MTGRRWDRGDDAELRRVVASSRFGPELQALVNEAAAARAHAAELCRAGRTRAGREELWREEALLASAWRVLERSAAETIERAARQRSRQPRQGRGRARRE